jgi:hypothetical protein
MSKIRLIEPPEEKFSWAKEMIAIDVDEIVKVREKYIKTVSPVISRDVLKQYKDRIYERDSTIEEGFVIIKRTK